jgi:hypothetical protein
VQGNFLHWRLLAHLAAEDGPMGATSSADSGATSLLRPPGGREIVGLEVITESDQPFASGLRMNSVMPVHGKRRR